MNDEVYVILVNWNGWRDTIECLESLFRIDYETYRVVVCDNGSSDGSIAHIVDWARGTRVHEPSSEDESLRRLGWPPVDKPIGYALYERREAECGGRDEDRRKRLVLIRSEENLGFAGGNNMALRYIQRRNDYKYAWILNNDTVVDGKALSLLVERMNRRPDVGICGSTSMFFEAPSIVQVAGGGSYNKWLGLPRNIGTYQPLSRLEEEKGVVSKMAYVYGASMLVSRQFIDLIGLMNEEYFLFFEELDWAIRSRGRFRMDYVAGSVIYHKEGRSGGNASNPKAVGSMADGFAITNRIRFARRYYPRYLLGVYCGVMLAVARRVVRGQPSRAKELLRCVLRERALCLGHRRS